MATLSNFFARLFTTPTNRGEESSFGNSNSSHGPPPPPTTPLSQHPPSTPPSTTSSTIVGDISTSSTSSSSAVIPSSSCSLDLKAESSPSLHLSSLSISSSTPKESKVQDNKFTFVRSDTRAENIPSDFDVCQPSHEGKTSRKSPTPCALGAASSLCTSVESRITEPCREHDTVAKMSLLQGFTGECKHTANIQPSPLQSLSPSLSVSESTELTILRPSSFMFLIGLHQLSNSVETPNQNTPNPHVLTPSKMTFPAFPTFPEISSLDWAKQNVHQLEQFVRQHPNDDTIYYFNLDGLSMKDNTETVWFTGSQQRAELLHTLIGLRATTPESASPQPLSSSSSSSFLSSLSSSSSSLYSSVPLPPQSGTQASVDCNCQCIECKDNVSNHTNRSKTTPSICIPSSSRRTSMNSDDKKNNQSNATMNRIQTISEACDCLCDECVTSWRDRLQHDNDGTSLALNHLFMPQLSSTENPAQAHVHLQCLLQGNKFALQNPTQSWILDCKDSDQATGCAVVRSLSLPVASCGIVSSQLAPNQLGSPVSWRSFLRSASSSKKPPRVSDFAHLPITRVSSRCIEHLLLRSFAFSIDRIAVDTRGCLAVSLQALVAMLTRRFYLPSLYYFDNALYEWAARSSLQSWLTQPIINDRLTLKNRIAQYQSQGFIPVYYPI